MARSIKIPTSPLSSQMAETEKQSKFQPLILREKRPTSMTLRSNCSIGSRKLGRLYSRTDSQVMNEDQLPENRKEVDDQDPKLHYSQGWHHETDNKDFSNGTESWSSFNQVTDEGRQKHIEVTITFKGTGVEVRGWSTQVMGSTASLWMERNGLRRRSGP